MAKRTAMVVPDHEGEAFWYGGCLATFRATSDQTGGTFVMLEMLAPRDTQTPLHVHEREDEAFVVVDGELDVHVDGQEFHAGPGAAVMSPHGVPHAFYVRSSEARLMFVFTPGIDSETFFREAGQAAGLRALPPPMPFDAEKATRAGEIAHIKTIGPAPFLPAF
jgi:mannose-6-phosphate isomerase-like protein (cupin superfamily)